MLSAMKKNRGHRPRSDDAYIAQQGWPETLRFGLLRILKIYLPVAVSLGSILELVATHLQ
jgi:hypothetical protein